MGAGPLQITTPVGVTELLGRLAPPGRCYAVLQPQVVTGNATLWLPGTLALGGQQLLVKDAGFVVTTAVTLSGGSTAPTIAISRGTAAAGVVTAGYFVAAFSLTAALGVVGAQFSVWGQENASWVFASTADTEAERVLTTGMGVFVVITQNNADAGAIIPWVEVEYYENAPVGEPVSLS